MLDIRAEGAAYPRLGATHRKLVFACETASHPADILNLATLETNAEDFRVQCA
jgi:hypothetical protein